MATTYTSADALCGEGSEFYLSYLRTTDLNDLQLAIDCFRRAFESEVTVSDPTACLVVASNACLKRFDVLGTEEDLASGMAYATRAIKNCSYQHKGFLGCLENFSNVIKNGMPSPVDLDFAIEVHRQALNFFSSASLEVKRARPEARILISLGGIWKFRHFSRSGHADIEEAVDCYCQALKLPMPMFNRIICLECASESLVALYEKHGRQEDLDRAMGYAKDAVECSDSEGVCPADSLSILGLVLRCQYEATGDMTDLNAAIDASHRAVNAADLQPKIIRCQRLTSLSKLLVVRGMRTGDSEDDIYAMELAQRAADIWPPNHPRRVEPLIFLSSSENYTLEDTKLRERSFGHILEARSLYAKHSSILNPRLGFYLGICYASLLVDMNRCAEATTVLQSLLGTYPDFMSDPHAHLFLYKLSTCHFELWRQNEKREEIDEAITRGYQMVNLSGLSAPDAVGGRFLLGYYLYRRSQTTGDKTRDKNDLEAAIGVLQEGFQTVGVVPHLRIIIRRQAIEVLCKLADCNWDLAQRLSKEIVDLYTLMTGRSLQWKDKQWFLSSASYQVSTYAAISLQAGSSLFDVIDMLETCRGIIFGQLIDTQTDLDDLKEVAPEKAERFSALRDELNSSSCSLIDPAGNMDICIGDSVRKSRAEEEIRTCLEEIRKLEGFNRFLLGPSQCELQAAAVAGPIVIVNVTSIRSDAIIVTKDISVSLELSGLSYDKVEEFPEAVQSAFGGAVNFGKANKKYRTLLKWLWNNCVKLIFEKLDDLIPGNTKFHIWWIGIGIASCLPFHAAGIYTNSFCETALDRAISSYSPTLKILIHGRRKLKTDQLKRDTQRTPTKPEFLIVTMPSTPGISDLQGVEDESAKLQVIVKDFYSVQTSCQPSASDTMELMKKGEVMHFACHGQVNSEDPSGSHLLLQTTDSHSMAPRIDKLAVKDVAALNLSHGKLAFLSACSTAEINPYSGLQDEVLHLASAFHVAGYSHTVGNLWLAEDTVSVEITAGFYQNLVNEGDLDDGQNVALALNKTLIDVSKKYPLEPLNWAKYVHFGL